MIPLAEYQRRRQDLEQRQTALDAQANQLRVQADRRKELAGLVTHIEDFCQRVQLTLESATFEQKRQLVELLIDRVIVTDDQVEIRYVIPTSSGSEHVRFCHLRSDYFAHSNLIGADDHQVLHEMGIARKGVLAVRCAPLFRLDFPLHVHQLHQALRALAIHRQAAPQQFGGDALVAVARPLANDIPGRICSILKRASTTSRTSSSICRMCPWSS